MTEREAYQEREKLLDQIKKLQKRNSDLQNQLSEVLKHGDSSAIFTDLFAEAENRLQTSPNFPSLDNSEVFNIGETSSSKSHKQNVNEQSKRESFEKLQDDFVKLFSLSLDIICVADINKEIFERVNPAFTRILGYPLEEVEGKPYLDFLHPEDIEPTAAIVEKQLKAGKKVVDFQNRHLCKNGQYKWLQWFAYPDPARGKNYAIGRDITKSKLVEEKLRKSEDRYHALYNAMREGMAIHEIIYDDQRKATNYRILEVNTSYEEILGISREEAVGTLATELYKTEEAPYLDEFSKVSKSGIPITFQTYFPGLDKHFHITVIRIKTDTFATIFEDFTDFLRKDQRLEQSLTELSNTKALLNAVFQQAPIPMAVVNQDLTIDIINSAARKILDIPDENEEKVSNLAELTENWTAYSSSGEIIPKEENHLIQGLQGLSVQGDEIRIQFNDGSEKWSAVYSSPIYNENRELIAAFCSFPDITERRLMETELRRLATTDPLTGANNRRKFLEQAEEEFKRARRYGNTLTLLNMDIDHFKKVNDSYGHLAGDAVLKELVTQCKAIIRTTDILARMGGEEFSILFVQTGIDDAMGTSERLRAALEHHTCKTDGQDIAFTVSIGLSELRQHDSSFREIMSRADKALYRAKDWGRNCIKIM